MIHLSLQGHSERLHADPAFFPMEFGLHKPALYGQWATYDALMSDADLVLNSYPTGSGKTKAALLYLTQLARQPLACANCLFIAPTNELLRQHADDIKAFCARNQLPHQVILLTREHMDEYSAEIMEIAQGLSRRASRLVALLRDPRLVLRDEADNPPDEKRPYVLVTNPDLFYAAVFCRYGSNEVRPLLKLFLAGFQYLVVDEFHYYNPKQLANFLFFLAFWRQYGYFGDDYPSKVCLLSATPGERILTYLEKLDLAIKIVGPDTEPNDQNAQRLPSLAPVELELLTPEEIGEEGLVALTRTRLPQIRNWLEQRQQGAIISGALWRINLINDLLYTVAPNRIARLTGVESREGRRQATSRDLILATPTVDLGYNFERQDKPRQSLDFEFFDAAFADEFIQRLGRAGRVLGKLETSIPSQVVGIVPKEVLAALRPLVGRPCSRDELRTVLQEAALPDRNDLFEYVATGAIAETFLPILQLADMTASSEIEDVRGLFDRVRKVFGASERCTFEKLAHDTRRYRRNDAIFRRAPTEPAALVRHILSLPEDRGLRAWLNDYAQARRSAEGEPDQAAFVRIKAEAGKLGTQAGLRLLEWSTSTYEQYAISAARFNFRETFQPPLARVYDPHHLLSSADESAYDAFHIAQNYYADFLDPPEWSRLVGMPAAAGDDADIVLYCALRELRQPRERVRMRFSLECDSDVLAWETGHLCQMTALCGLRVVPDVGQIDAHVISAVQQQYIPAFLAPEETIVGGMLVALCRNRGARQYSLFVRFASGGSREYRVVFGTFALLASARLQKACYAFHRQRGKDYSEPIWC